MLPGLMLVQSVKTVAAGVDAMVQKVDVAATGWAFGKWF